MQIDGDVLIGYTDWERQKWHDWLAHHTEALRTSVGPHGDNQTVGDVVKHIFSAEKRYIERLSDEPLTDTASIPNDNLEALFELGQQSRQALKNFIESLPAASWDILKGFRVCWVVPEGDAEEDCSPRPNSRNTSLGANCNCASPERF